MRCWCIVVSSRVRQFCRRARVAPVALCVPTHLLCTNTVPWLVGITFAMTAGLCTLKYKLCKVITPNFALPHNFYVL